MIKVSERPVGNGAVGSDQKRKIGGDQQLVGDFGSGMRPMFEV